MTHHNVSHLQRNKLHRAIITGMANANTLLEAVRHFRSVVIDAGSRLTTVHARECCIFQSYVKTVPSRIKVTMKLTMREPASMTTDTWSRRVTFYSNSVLGTVKIAQTLCGLWCAYVILCLTKHVLHPIFSVYCPGGWCQFGWFHIAPSGSGCGRWHETCEVHALLG